MLGSKKTKHQARYRLVYWPKALPGSRPRHRQAPTPKASPKLSPHPHQTPGSRRARTSTASASQVRSRQYKHKQAQARSGPEAGCVAWWCCWCGKGRILRTKPQFGGWSSISRAGSHNLPALCHCHGPRPRWACLECECAWHVCGCGCVRPCMCGDCCQNH